jgi:hypothetical protein
MVPVGNTERDSAFLTGTLGYMQRASPLRETRTRPSALLTSTVVALKVRAHSTSYLAPYGQT